MLLCVFVVRRLADTTWTLQECVVVFAFLKLKKQTPVLAQKRREPSHREICVFKAKPASKMVRVLQRRV